jgi:phosphate/sulfate permease
VELSSEGAMVVVLAQSLVLFIFSSSGLSSFFVRLGLPPIPLVPVSSSQVIVGCVIGIGIYKGVSNINFKLLGEIALGWLATPIMSGLLSFFSLFIVKNIFSIEVGRKVAEGTLPAGNIPVTAGDPAISGIIRFLLAGIIAAGLLVAFYYWLLERKKRRELRLSEEKFWKNLK